MIGAEPTSYALDIDLASTVPWRDWPMDPKPARCACCSSTRASSSWCSRGGPRRAQGWPFDFRKVLASDSQAFDLVAERQVVAGANCPGPGWLPGRSRWRVVLAGACALQRQRIERRRAEELLRLGQVARLNALGELAAGMAHELNQPLTAVLANTQAARRLLDEDPPELGTARDAMQQAAEQARRAADVVARLRRVIERPGQPRRGQAGGAAGGGAQRAAPAGARNSTGARSRRPSTARRRRRSACRPSRWRWSRSSTTC